MEQGPVRHQRVCVEYGVMESGKVLLRVSEEPYETLVLTREEVHHLVTAVKAGWLDHI